MFTNRGANFVMKSLCRNVVQYNFAIRDYFAGRTTGHAMFRADLKPELANRS